jgi:proton-translocating NADH-quinone oxidoreductase chain N
MVISILNILLVGKLKKKKNELKEKKNMLLSLSLFLNLFTLTLFGPVKTGIRISKLCLLLILLDLIIDNNYILGEIILLDGNILINKMILFEEIIIIIFTFFILTIINNFSIKIELILILITNILGMFFLLSSYDFFIFLISWELYNFSFYIIISYSHSNHNALSAALKYFLLSALSTAILLYSLTIIYSEIGNLHYENILIIMNNYINNNLKFGFFLFSISLLFKLSAVPFHYWAPDLYDNQPTRITIWIAILPKLLIFFIIINLINILHIHQSLFFILGFLSIIFGALGLTQQYKIKRFLTYSAITNVGYFLLSYTNITTLIINIIIYSLTTLNIFAILIFLEKQYNREITSLSQLKGLFQFNPILSIIFSISIFSLAGIPPLAGFFGKLLLLEHYINYYSGILFLIIILSIVISTSNYIKLLYNINFNKDNFINSQHFINFNSYGLNFIITFNTLAILTFILQPYEIMMMTINFLN